VILITVPPLRERKDDIPYLVEYFLGKNAPGKKAKKITSEAMKLLLNYRWPGNVRELENTIERLMILTAGDIITVEHLSQSLKNTSSGTELMPLDIPETGIDLERLLQNAERTMLYKALDKAGGVKTDAAKLLGLSFRSFRHRLQKYEHSS